VRLVVRTLLGVLLVSAVVTGDSAEGQAPTVDVRITPEPDPLPASPGIVLSARNVPVISQPVTLQLEISRSRGFDQLLFASATLGDTASFRPSIVLPEADSVFLRVTLLDVAGRQLVRQILGHRTAERVILRRPIGPLNVAVDTLRPLFVWSGAQLLAPPGPWVYELTVINALTDRAAFRQDDIVDTTLRPQLALEANTPYRWQVRARLPNGPDTTRGFAQSQSTFVITGAPTVTLLYQNFPNPFPNGLTSSTCIWFDLSERATVRLVIRDLRGNMIRVIENGVSLGAGNYGRGGEGPQAGCVPQYSWDGTTADGRTVPPGVYLLHFRAGGVEIVRKMLFRGSR
jgi:hypothetical protein